MAPLLGQKRPRRVEFSQMRLAGINKPKPEYRRWFSSLTLRILAPNVLALCVLVAGIFYLDQYRDGLLNTKITAMQSQAEMIAGALGEIALCLADVKLTELASAILKEAFQIAWSIPNEWNRTPALEQLEFCRQQGNLRVVGKSR